MTRQRLERVRRIVASGGPYRVQSLANDTYLVKRNRKDPYGLLERLAMAKAIEDALNARVAK